VLLAIAVGAMLIACILLALEMNSYEWKKTPNVASLNAPHSGSSVTQHAPHTCIDSARAVA
jgi:hypothetical protein